jgi:DUF1009 family protein
MTAGDTPAGALAVICGAGELPRVVAAAVAGQRRRVVMFPLVGWADRGVVTGYAHHWIHVGQIGRFARLAGAEGCSEVVMIGALVRPSLSQLRFDWSTLRALPRLARAFRAGDDGLLSEVGKIVESHGLRMRGAHEVAPDILIPAGVLGSLAPNARQQSDIARGFALLAAIGPHDIGQAVVVADGRVLAVEAAEGTDDMLARVAALRASGRVRLAGRSGVLVKAPKPGQDRRYDLPAIGLRTIEGAVAAGLAGIAVESGGAITADLQAVVSAADAAGLFLIGVGRPGVELPA